MTYVKTSLNLFLFSVGVIPCCRFKILERIWGTSLILMLIALAGGEIVAYFATQDRIYQVEICFQGLSYIYILCTLVISLQNRQLLLTTCARINGEVTQYGGDKVKQRTEKIFKKIAIIFVGVFLTSLIAYTAVPLINYYIKRDYHDPLSYLLPYWLTGAIDSPIKYLFMMSLQCLLGWTTYYLYANNFSFTVCAITSISTHAEELQSRIRNLDHSQEKLYMRASAAVVEDMNRKEFQEVIKYQQMLHSLHRDLSTYFSKVFSAAIAWFIVGAILIIFMNIQIVSTSLVFVIRLSAVYVNLMLVSFFFCYIAEVLCHTNEILLASYYGMLWYAMPVKSRRDIIIAMIQNQKSVEIKAFGMYVMNLKLFAVFLRVIYSVLNILLKVRK